MELGRRSLQATLERQTRFARHLWSKLVLEVDAMCRTRKRVSVKQRVVIEAGCLGFVRINSEEGADCLVGGLLGRRGRGGLEVGRCTGNCERVHGLQIVLHLISGTEYLGSAWQVQCLINNISSSRPRPDYFCPHNTLCRNLTEGEISDEETSPYTFLSIIMSTR